MASGFDREDPVKISDAEVIELSKLVNKRTGIVRRDYPFVDVVKSIVNGSVARGKEYNESFVAICIVAVVNEMMGYDRLIIIDTTFYQRNIRVFKKMMRYETVFALLEVLTPENDGPKCLGIFSLNDVRLYTATMKELQIIVTAASNFVKSRH